MNKQMLRLTSVTYAIRAQKVLERHGIRAQVRKLTQTQSAKGCGYALEIYGDLQQANRIVTEAGIRVVEILEGI